MRSFKIKDGKVSSIKDGKASTTTLSAPCATSPCTGEAKKNTHESCTGEAKKDNLKSCAGEAKKNNLKQKYYALRKYAIIILCLLATVCMSVGFSKWNIHLKRTLTTDDGNGFFNYAPSYNATTDDEGAQTITPILEYYLTFESGTDTIGGTTDEKSNASRPLIAAEKSKNAIGKNSYQTEYNGKSVTVSVSDNYYTLDESEKGYTSNEVLTKWSDLAKVGLKIEVVYYTIIVKDASTEYSVATDTKNAGDYLCVLTAGYDENSDTATTEEVKAANKESAENTAANLNVIDNPATSVVGKECAAAIYFTVNPKEVTVTWTKNADGYTYNGKEQHPDARLSGVVSGDDCTVSVSGGTNAGTHTAIAILTGENSANYRLTENTECQFEIQPYKLKNSDVKWDADTLSFVYDGDTHVPTASVENLFYNEAAKIVDKCTLIVAVENNKKDVGTYSAKVTWVSNTNYTFSDNITTTFTVTARSITVKIGSAESVYGEDPVTNFTYSVTSGSIVDGENERDIFTLKSDVTGKGYPVGKYDITGSTENATNKNYTVDFTDGDNAYTVTKRKIKVILKDTSHVYGSAPQDLTWTIESNYNPKLSTPLVNGDKESDIFRVYFADNNNTEIALNNNIGAGDYRIMGESVGNDNYEVAFSNEGENFTYAAYEVKKATLTVTPLDTEVDTGSIPDYNYEIIGFVLNEKQETVAISGKPSFTSDYTGYPNAATKAGDFTFWIDSENSKLSADNYDFVYSNEKATLKVNQHIVKIPIPNKFNKTYTYDGKEKEVSLEDLDLDIYNGYADYIQISGLSGDDNVKKATDAGSYSVKIALKQNDNVQVQWEDGTKANKKVQWTISPCKLSINNKVIERDYRTSGVSLSTDLFSDDNAIIDGNSEKQNAANTPYTSVVTINYARNDLSLTSAIQDGDNGKFYYESGNTITVGSTYEIKLSLNSTNYVFDDGTDNGASTTVAYLKYKTAKVGGTLYTIEDALKASGNGDIILQGGSPYVLTAFSKLGLRSLVDAGFKNYYLNYGYTLDEKNLIVPYKDGITGTTESDYQTETAGQDVVYSVLCIPEGITLSVNKTIDITAYVAYHTGDGTTDNGVCTVYNRGVVMNNGTIDVQSGGSINAYGYLKSVSEDNGIVILRDGAVVTDLFHMYDYMGGSVSSGLNDAKFFPVSQYSLHNVSCSTRIYSGAAYKAFYAIDVSIIGWQCDTIIIIGNTTKALFQMTTTSGYIDKWASKAASWTSDSDNGKALHTISGSNQKRGQRDVVYMNNVTVKDNQVKISVKGSGLFSLIDYSMETSPDMACPITFMDVTVCNKSTLNLQSASYKFLAGASLTIEDTATFTTSSSIKTMFLTQEQCTQTELIDGVWKYFYPVDKKDAQLKVNGEAILNGYVSGNITTENPNALLSISNNSAVTIVIKEVTPKEISVGGYTVTTYEITKTEDLSMTAQGIQSDGGDATTMAANTYISVLGEDGKTCYWKLADDVKFVNFDYQGGEGSTFTEVLFKGTDGNYVLTEVPKPYDRDHYTFVGWFTDTAYTKKVDPLNNLNNTYSDNNTITLYAKWQVETFTIEYIRKGAGGIDLSNVQISNANKTVYEYGDKVVLEPATTTTQGYYFVGWFQDEACTKSITEIEVGSAQDFTIYGLWTNEAPISYTINFDVGDAKSENVTFATSQLSFNGLKSFDNSYSVPDIYATWNGYTALLNSDFMASYVTIATYKHYSFKWYFAGWTLSYTDKDGNAQGENYDIATPTITFSGGATNITLTAIWYEKSQLAIEYVDAKGNFISGVNTSYAYFAPGIGLTSEIVNAVCTAYAPTYYAYLHYKVGGTNGEEGGSIYFNKNENYTITAYYQRYYHIIIGGDTDKIASGAEIWVRPLDENQNSVSEYTITDVDISGLKAITNTYDRYTLTGEYSVQSPNDGTVKCGGTTIGFIKADSSVDITLVAETQHWYKVINNYSDVTVTATNSSDVDGQWYKEGTPISITLKGYTFSFGLRSKSAIITNASTNVELDTITVNSTSSVTSMKVTTVSCSITINQK